MKTCAAQRPNVPISYVLLLLDVAREYGVDRQELLDGLGISDELLEQPDGRIRLLDEYARLCIRALKLTGEPALAYEFGLRATLTTHGIIGFGVMSQRTLRDVFSFTARFGSVLRLPAWELRFVTDQDSAVIEAHEAVPHGSLRRFSCEQLLSSLASIVQQLLPNPTFELRFDYPEPDYHARYRHYWPKTRFMTGVTQLRMPLEYLDRPLRTADAVSAKLAERECERELALLGSADDLVKGLRALMVNQDGCYPSLEVVAEQLHLTTRTLIRRLSVRGCSFRQLLDEARQRDSQTLLRDPTLSLADIANRLGYSTAANFSRAFRGWTGLSPGQFRQQPSG